MQPNNDGKRSRWIEKILEYDLEIKPTKLLKGQGLEKLLTESNCKDLGINIIQNISASEGELPNEGRDLKVHISFYHLLGTKT